MNQVYKLLLFVVSRRLVLLRKHAGLIVASIYIAKLNCYWTVGVVFRHILLLRHAMPTSECSGTPVQAVTWQGPCLTMMKFALDKYEYRRRSIEQ